MADPQDELSNQFTGLFNSLAPHHHRYTVFADFVELAYCAIRQKTLPPGPESDAVEERYMTIVHKHKPDDIREMPKLLAWTQMALADPDDFEVDIYEVTSLRELAMQFVDDGLFGEIPENIQGYLDYDAIARDLAADYSETTIAGTRLVYRCG